MAAQLTVVADNTGMILYENMCKAIAECHRVDEVKDIRDKAIALEKYSQQAKNYENERMAREIRLRAERKCGELLAKLPKAPTRSRYVTGLTAGTAVKKSKQVERSGFSETQARRFEHIATIPKDKFEQEVIKPKASTKGLNDYARRIEPEPPKPKSETPKPEWLKQMNAQNSLLGSLHIISQGLKKAVTGLKMKDEDLRRMTEVGAELPNLVANELRLIQTYMAKLTPLCPCPLKKGAHNSSNLPIVISSKGK